MLAEQRRPKALKNIQFILLVFKNNFSFNKVKEVFFENVNG